MKYIIFFYLFFVIIEGTFVLAVDRKPSKIEGILLWPIAKILKGLNFGLRKLSNK